jgi:antitoxin component YwqK of YwqJK toxin-antitoxin module
MSKRNVMSSKKIIICSLFLLFNLQLFSQPNKNAPILNRGDTIIIPTYKKSKLLKEDFRVKDELVLQKKYYYRKAYYLSFAKDPRSLNKKAVVVKSFWLNGNPRIDGYSLDGKHPEGKYRTFHENGKPQCDCNYLNGKREGKQIYHYDNGQLGSEVIYKQGVPWTIVRSFNEDGKPQGGNLKEGEGTFYVYSKDKHLKKIEHYKLGVLVKKEKVKKKNN